MTRGCYINSCEDSFNSVAYLHCVGLLSWLNYFNILGCLGRSTITLTALQSHSGQEYSQKSILALDIYALHVVNRPLFLYQVYASYSES